MISGKRFMGAVTWGKNRTVWNHEEQRNTLF